MELHSSRPFIISSTGRKFARGHVQCTRALGMKRGSVTITYLSLHSEFEWWSLFTGLKRRRIGYGLHVQGELQRPTPV